MNDDKVNSLDWRCCTRNYTKFRPRCWPSNGSALQNNPTIDTECKNAIQNIVKSMVLENLTRAPEVQVIKNIFGQHRVKGYLFPHLVLILTENKVFETSGCAIAIPADAKTGMKATPLKVFR